MSTHVSNDAISAYQRLRRQAQMLGSISSSLNALAVSLTAAYSTALLRPTPEAWAALVTRTATLVARTHALPPILVLDAQERDALVFFEAIVRENADLLVSPDHGWDAISPAPRPYFPIGRSKRNASTWLRDRDRGARSPETIERIDRRDAAAG